MSSQYTDDAPLAGPLGEPLKGDLLEQLLRKQRKFGSSLRKRRMYRKYRVWREDTRGLVADAIVDRQNDERTRTEMMKFITGVRNDALDIARASAVVWMRGATRTLAGRTSKRVRQAIADLERETMIDAIAPGVNQLGFLQGPQITIPIVRGGALNLDTLPAHLPDVVHNIDDPCGEPAAVAWSEAYAVDGRSSHTLVLDSTYLRHFRFEGDHPVEDETRRIEHHGGFCPCSTFRTRLPLLGDDWWDHTINQRLIEGTIEALVVLTALSFVRKSQCKRLLALIGNLEGIPKGTVLDPERPFKARTKTPDAVKFETIDFDTPPDSFLKHALFLAHSMAEPYGGRVEATSGQPMEFAKIVIPHEAQTELRHAQVPHAKRYERHLWSGAVVMMRAQGHDHASVLPDAREMDERFRVDYGALSRTIADPVKESERQTWELKHGLISEFELMQQRLGPGATRDEARGRVMQNLDDRSEFNDLVTTRALNLDGDRQVLTAPEAFGSMGTPAREANRKADQAEQDEDAGPRVG